MVHQLMLRDALAAATVFGVKLSCKYAFEVAPTVTVPLFEVARRSRRINAARRSCVRNVH